MANNLAQKDERNKWSNKIKKWTDTGWMYVKKVARSLSDRARGVEIKRLEDEQAKKRELDRKRYDWLRKNNYRPK